MKDDGLLNVVNVVKDFRGLRAISEVSLTVQTGEIHGLIGPNGAGKTTLFNLISGFMTPEKGTVEFLGVNICGYKPNQICKMGLVRTFQIVKPFRQLSTLENVAVGAYNHGEDTKKVEAKTFEILELVGLAPKALSPAESLTTPDRKRLELARALATEPKLLLLDETMAGLNPTEQLQVVELIKRIRDRGITVLIIEHHMRVIMRLCDRITVLNHGVCIAQGDPRSVCCNQEVIQAYLGKEHTFAAR